MGHEKKNICMACGNTKLFKVMRYWRLDATTHDVYDCEEKQYVEEEIPDKNIDDGVVIDSSDLECYECGGDDVKADLDEEEMLEVKVLHTYEDGMWSSIKLPEKEQNTDLKAELVEMRL